MTSLLRRKPALPNTIEDHPTFVQHARQRGELVGSLTAAQAELARLTAERDRLAGDRQEAAVQAILRGGTEASTDVDGMQDQIDRLAPDIQRVNARVEAVTEAVRRLDAREAEIRAAIRLEMTAQVRDAGRAVIGQLAKALREASIANAELARLEKYGLVEFSVQSWPELITADVAVWGRPPGKLNSWLERAQSEESR